MSASYNGAGVVTSYDNAAANLSSATYDGNGLRSSDTVTPAGGSQSTQGFVWNTTTSVPQLLMDGTNAYIYAEGNAPIEQVNLSTGTVHYLVGDALGSVRGVVNSSGTVTASTSYDAWGNPETSGGMTASTPFGFAGGYTDPTGLVYLVNRYYDPGTGQFLSVDPLVDRTGQAYGYTGENPVNQVDPNGLTTLAGADAFSSRQPCQPELSISVRSQYLRDLAVYLYVNDVAERNFASFIATHRWEIYAAASGGGLVLAAGGVACAAGVCEALAAGTLALATAEEELQGELPDLTPEERVTYEDIVNNENNLAHVFDVKHNFGTLIEKLGSPEAVLSQIVRGLSTTELPASGPFNQAPVLVGGQIVFVNGTVINGIARIGSAFVPPPP